jgi:hypothetical protein
MSKRFKAEAVCDYCGGRVFKIALFAGDGWQAFCNACSAIWKEPGKGESSSIANLLRWRGAFRPIEVDDEDE